MIIVGGVIKNDIKYHLVKENELLLDIANIIEHNKVNVIGIINKR